MFMCCCCNESGLFEYDHDDSKARALEKAIGIKVIRHSKFLLCQFEL
jgi:hypothetical protein